jgi:hypothetical protein
LIRIGVELVLEPPHFDMKTGYGARDQLNSNAEE